MHYPEPVMGGVIEVDNPAVYHPNRQDFEDEKARQNNREFRIKSSELKD